MQTSSVVILKKYYIILNHCSIEISSPEIFWVSDKFIHKLWPPELQKKKNNTFCYINRFLNLNSETPSLIEYGKYKFSKSDSIAVYKTLYLLR